MQCAIKPDSCKGGSRSHGGKVFSSWQATPTLEASLGSCHAVTSSAFLCVGGLKNKLDTAKQTNEQYLRGMEKASEFIQSGELRGKSLPGLCRSRLMTCSGIFQCLPMTSAGKSLHVEK